MPDFIGIINTVHFGSLPHYDRSFAQGETSTTMLEYIYNEIRKDVVLTILTQNTVSYLALNNMWTSLRRRETSSLTLFSGGGPTASPIFFLVSLMIPWHGTSIEYYR